MSILPDSKLWLVLMAAIAFLNPLQYILLSHYPPDGFTFSGFGGDESVFFTTMESVKWGMTNPWGDGSIFLNPAFGPVYIFVPLGLISAVTGISAFMIFLIFIFLSSLLFLIVSYHFIKNFSEKHGNAYFLFTLTAGFGGILVLLLKIFTFSNLLDPTPLYAFGITVIRILGSYKILAFSTGLLSILFATKQKTTKSGIFLGITFLFYPFFGAATGLLLLTYMISNRKYLGIIRFAKTILFSMPFVFAWAIPYIINPSSFKSYAEVGQHISGVFLPTLVLGWGPAFVLGCYWIYKSSPKLRRNARIKLVLWVASIVLFSLANITLSFWATFDNFARSFLSSLGLLGVAQSLGAVALILEIPLFVMILVAGYQIYADLENPRHRFMFLWLFVVSLLVIAPPILTYSFGAKIHAFVWIPIAVLGAEGIYALSKNANNRRKILAISFMLSLPTLFFLVAYGQTAPRSYTNYDNLEFCCYLYTESEQAGMEFLSTQPRGLVLSSIEIGTWLPAHSGQKAMLHLYLTNFVRNSQEKVGDVKEFFESDDQTRVKTINKYGIDYVFDNKGKLQETSYMERIFEDEDVRVFRIVK